MSDEDVAAVLFGSDSSGEAVKPARIGRGDYTAIEYVVVLFVEEPARCPVLVPSQYVSGAT